MACKYMHTWTYMWRCRKVSEHKCIYIWAYISYFEAQTYLLAYGMITNT